MTTVPQSGSYVERLLNFTFTIGQGQFGETGSNTVKVTGLRSFVSLDLWGLPGFNVCNARIYGLPPTILNQISTLGTAVDVMARRNEIAIEAGDAVNGMTLIHKSIINQAWSALNDQPETCLQILASGGQIANQQPQDVISVDGPTDVPTIMAKIAKNLGYNFLNDGVSAKVDSAYLDGSGLKQAYDLAQAANIEIYVDNSKDPPLLSIWPRNGTRSGSIPLISPETGMIGYPEWSGTGLKFKTLFSPTVPITKGGTVEIKSSYTQANGPWYITKLNYNLASNAPNAAWFVECEAVNQKNQLTTKT